MERLARERLEQSGYRVLAVNHRTRAGELDLVAVEGGYLVGVEVRTKRGPAFGTPEESITVQKAERLARLVEQYAVDHPGLPDDLRVDLVAVELTLEGELMRVEIIQNAVEDG